MRFLKNIYQNHPKYFLPFTRIIQIQKCSCAERTPIETNLPRESVGLSYCKRDDTLTNPSDRVPREPFSRSFYAAYKKSWFCFPHLRKRLQSAQKRKSEHNIWANCARWNCIFLHFSMYNALKITLGFPLLHTLQQWQRAVVSPWATHAHIYCVSLLVLDALFIFVSADSNRIFHF